MLIHTYFTQLLASEPKSIPPTAEMVEVKYHEYCWLRFYLTFDKTMKIFSVAFRVMGSPTLMALAFWLSEQLPGLKCEQLQGIKAQYICQAFQLEEIHFGEAALVEQMVERIASLEFLELQNDKC